MAKGVIIAAAAACALSAGSSALALQDVDLAKGVSADPGQRLLEAARAAESRLGSGRMQAAPRSTGLFTRP